MDILLLLKDYEKFFEYLDSVPEVFSEKIKDNFYAFLAEGNSKALKPILEPLEFYKTNWVKNKPFYINFKKFLDKRSTISLVDSISLVLLTLSSDVTHCHIQSKDYGLYPVSLEVLTLLQYQMSLLMNPSEDLLDEIIDYLKKRYDLT